MPEDVYDLNGPFAESLKSLDASQLITFSVKIREERNSVHPLNAVGQLKRVVSIGNHESTNALLLLSHQFLEVFAIVSEAHTQSPTGKNHAAFLTRKLKSVASSAGHAMHVAKRSKSKDVAAEDSTSYAEPEDPEEMEKVQEILKDHVLAIGVALGQVLKIRMSGTDLTVYYHPNDFKSLKFGKILEGAMRFSFSLETAQEARRLMEALTAKINRYNQAAVFLRTEMVLPNEMHVVAVTRPLKTCQGQVCTEEEVVVAKDAAWGKPYLSAPSWGAQAKDSTDPLWVYMSTPMGYGKAEISPQVVAQYARNGSASFFVGVRHPQAQSAVLATVSRLERVPTHAREHEDDVEQDDSEENWQPESSAESSVGQDLQIGPVSHHSKTNELGRVSMAKGRNGRHIRLHCSAAYRPQRRATASTPPSTEPSSSQSSQPKGSLPGVAAGQEALVSIILVGLAIVTLLLGYKHSALLFLNLAIAFFTYVHTAEGTTRSSQSLKSRDSPRTDDLPDWEIVLVKAEVVRDEQFQEHGSSVLVNVHADDSEEAVDSRKQEVAARFGLSDDEVDRYLLAYHDDEAAAHSKMATSSEWRRENGAVDVLHQKAPHFQFFKQMFHHALLGVTKDGHPIWFMKVGDMKSGFKTFKQSQLSSKDLARHVALCMDYMYHVVETAPLPNGRALWVLDLKGMGLTDIGSEAFDLGKQIAGMIGAHWPERLYRAFIINMPGFFSVLWKLVEPMMAASTRRKIRLLRGKESMIKEMTEEMSVDHIPVSYGGKLVDVYDAPAEKEFWAYVAGLDP